VSNVLEGVARPTDANQSFLLAATAISQCADSLTNDTFTLESTDIFVVDVTYDANWCYPTTDASVTDPRAIGIILPLTEFDVDARRDRKPILCSKLTSQSVTVATVDIDVDLYKLEPMKRVELVRIFASYLDLSSNSIRLLPCSEDSELKGDTLVVGSGDQAPSRRGEDGNSRGGAMLQWVVGCGNVEESQMKVEFNSSANKIEILG